MASSSASSDPADPSTSHQPLDIESVRAKMFPSYTHNYTHRDAILYALALGYTAKDLQYVYEHHPQFRPLPLYAIIAAHPSLSGVPLDQYIPGFDRGKALHGEQYLRVLAPLPAHGQLVTQPYLVDIRDKGKGKGAVAIVRSVTRDATLGHIVAENEFVAYVLGAGGFGSPWSPYPRPDSAAAANRAPNRQSDYQALVQTSPDQAALYRLCGDYNPLHIDPGFANKVGFPQPILHGLCTMGLSVKAVVETVAGGRFETLRSAKVRFSRPCLPGDTLRVRMWRETSDTTSPPTTSSTSTSSQLPPQPPQSAAKAPGLVRIVFETSIVSKSGETGSKEVVVINGAAVELDLGAASVVAQSRL